MINKKNSTETLLQRSEGHFESILYFVVFVALPVNINSFWTEGYAGQIPNSGHELAIYVHTMIIVK